MIEIVDQKTKVVTLSHPNLVEQNSLNQMKFNSLKTKEHTKELIYSDLPSSVRDRINIDEQIQLNHSYSRGAPNRIDIRSINQNS